MFDIFGFYPSITYDILMAANNLAMHYCHFPEPKVKNNKTGIENDTIPRRNNPDFEYPWEHMILQRRRSYEDTVAMETLIYP